MMEQQTSARVTTKKLSGRGLTPLGIMERLPGTRKFLLESSAESNGRGRFSFIGSEPVKSFIGSAEGIRETDHRTGVTISHEGDLFDLLKQLIPSIDSGTVFPFAGGAVGCCCYEAGDPGRKREERTEPLAFFHVYNTVAVYDHLLGEITLIHTETGLENRTADLGLLEDRLLAEDPGTGRMKEAAVLSEFRSALPESEFEEDVQAALHAIWKGEAEQIVLSRRMEAELTGNPVRLYEQLRERNPSPYMYYMEFDDQIILGASPESLVKAENGIIRTNPIAGTRPRGRDRAEDEALEQSLRNDPKELAEHEMLVELSRHEMEQFCEAGSVRVTARQATVRYEHVMHLVSELEGRLAAGKHAMDAFRACLPAGTVTGSPKAAAMEFIRTIERTPRGVYGGAVGYVGFNGNLDAALAIRTMVVRGNTAVVQAGAGIVAASDPHRELLETVHKARSLTSLGQV
ncbi:anthranilate synthase component I [Sporosarcina sp. NCCP-2716]|uniref:anthranilate synthase component I family protein n=1 Tax=Sporosarcina sp. NCCP-2716 TaxID=2943679 RepID=UPI0020426BB4|nr:chorismate-binding protein [Sporosarcina sp. NCCP-2716]GKV68511.1 anthranilate synthase component I [Sporosarcina sp. NCCP-2716]